MRSIAADINFLDPRALQVSIPTEDSIQQGFKIANGIQNMQSDPHLALEDGTINFQGIACKFPIAAYISKLIFQ